MREGAARVPLCCYASASIYAGEDAAPTRGDTTTGVKTVAPPRNRQHSDRRGRVYSYDYHGGRDQAVVGTLGGMPTGLIGFGIGVLGVAHLVIRRIPIRIGVGTSHFVILIVTGAAVAAHLFEMSSSNVTPPWNVVAANAVAVLVGGQLAAWLAGRLPEQKIRKVLVVLLILLSIVTLYRAVSLAF